MTFDKEIKRVLKKLEYGVYIVSMGKGEDGNAFTASWLTQVSSEPPTIVLAVNSKHQSARMLNERDCFVVNLLARGAEGVAKTYYGPAESGYAKLEGVDVTPAPATGCPVISGAVAFLDCRIIKRVPCGNHTVFFAEVLAAQLNEDVDIMTCLTSRLRYTG
jgi:flavin reductase (DIM6/NTAB) family NADH-FMN oxidoreductase RutF